MITFQISAPGRVFLCGDHAVIYGKQVVAASLNIRTTLNFYQLPLETGIVKIELPNVGILLEIPLEQITSFIHGENFHLVIDHYPAFLRYVQYFISSNCLWRTFEQKFSLQIFFFLLWVIAQDEKLVIQPFYVHLNTRLTMNAGLGSSTSFATCLAACFLHWSCLQKGHHNEFIPEELERISTYVMSYEKMIPEFKQDNIVCTHGHVTALRYGESQYQNEIINTPALYIMLVDANIHSDKRQQLTDMISRDGNAVDNYLNTINVISEEIVRKLRIIRDQGTNADLQSLYENLRDKFFLNQKSLHELNLSHKNVDKICSIARTYGFEGKLTGDGAKNVMILLPPNFASQQYSGRMRYLRQGLMNEGFSFGITTISCTGVRLD